MRSSQRSPRRRSEATSRMPRASARRTAPSAATRRSRRRTAAGQTPTGSAWARAS